MTNATVIIVCFHAFDQVKLKLYVLEKWKIIFDKKGAVAMMTRAQHKKPLTLPRATDV